jgi:hypothetical protein
VPGVHSSLAQVVNGFFGRSDQKNQNSARQLYFDFDMGAGLSQDDFIAEILDDHYPACSLRTKTDMPYPSERRHKSHADIFG